MVYGNDEAAMITELSAERWDMVDVPLSLWARCRIWAVGVWGAIKTPPPETTTKYISLYPGDPGYEDAMLLTVWETFTPEFNKHDPNN